MRMGQRNGGGPRRRAAAAGGEGVQKRPIVAAAADDAEGAGGGVEVRGDGVRRSGVRLERGDGLVGHGRGGLIGAVGRGGSGSSCGGGRVARSRVVFVVRHGLVPVLDLHLFELIGRARIDEGRFGILWVVLGGLLLLCLCLLCHFGGGRSSSSLLLLLLLVVHAVYMCCFSARCVCID